MAMTKNERAALWLDGVMTGPFGPFLEWMIAKPCTHAQIAAALSTNKATVARALALLSDTAPITK